MKRQLFLGVLGWLLFTQLAAQPTTMVVKPSNGDEQGLEVPKSMVIPQDKAAYAAAINGWYAQDKKAQPNRTDWFANARFGCFVHWGVYSALAGEWKGVGSLGYGEHIMRSRKIPLAEYKEKVVATFDPAKFNATEWMKLASNAGMKYFIITAKHHDGFAMYPSNAYPFDIRQTKMQIDPMKELSAAAKKYGIKFGFYYSHAFDWEHPDAPGNDWDYNNPGGDKLLHGTNWWETYPQFLPNAEKYVNEKSIPQILELIKVYHPDILWFDTPHKLPMYLNLKILKAIRDAGPAIVVNGRVARVVGTNFGDYSNTGDRAAFFRPTEGIWEAVPTTNESYGYNKFDTSHKNAAHFIRLLASAAAKGGNILLNIGPKGDGSIDTKDVVILNKVGKWMQLNSESIYGTTKNPIAIQSWGEITQKGNNLYLHIFQWPKNNKLLIGGLQTKVKKAFLLADPKQKALKVTLEYTTDMAISLEALTQDTANTVIKLVCDSIYNVNPIRLLNSNENNVLLVFDAATPGQRFAYGDGKRNKNVARNWKNQNQYLQWDVRLNEAATFHLELQYNTVNQTDSGTIIVRIDDVPYRIAYTPTSNANSTATLQLPDVAMGKGKHVIQLQLENYTGSEAMQPMQLLLQPRK